MLLGLSLAANVRSPDRIDPAFESMVAARTEAVVVHGSGMLNANRARIAEQAIKHRLPTLCSFRAYVAAGCLMSYWISPTCAVPSRRILNLGHRLCSARGSITSA